MILNFSKWKTLNEQTVTPTTPTSQTTTISYAWTKDPESLNIMKIFNGEFLPTVLGNTDELTIAEYISKLSELTSDQLASSIQFFKAKGYSQPNDKIKKFQEDLMNNTDYSTFTTTEDKTKPFNDGIFGRATSKALVNYAIKNMNKVTDKTVKVKTTKGFGGSKSAVPAAKITTAADVKTGVGTQTLR